jgi:hypothetical protein
MLEVAMYAICPVLGYYAPSNGNPSTVRNNPEEGRFQYRGGNLKSQMYAQFCLALCHSPGSTEVPVKN